MQSGQANTGGGWEEGDTMGVETTLPGIGLADCEGMIRLGVASLGGTSTAILSSEAGVDGVGVAEETGMELTTADSFGRRWAARRIKETK